MAEEKVEKTGGTPHGGRMAPGEEGRGAARRQRRPEIQGKRVAGMKELEERAIAVAKHLGHDPIVWRIEEEGNSGQIRCQGCRMKAGFALFPMLDPNTRRPKDPVNGPAVEERCTA